MSCPRLAHTLHTEEITVKIAVSNLDLFTLNQHLVSIVLFEDGKVPQIVGANHATFGSKMTRSFSAATRIYLGKGTRVDWSNLQACGRTGGMLKMVPNCNIIAHVPETTNAI